MEKENKKQELEKKIIEFSILDSRIKELEQNLTLLEKQIAELQSCLLSLDELKNIKKDTEMLSPISPGVFTKSKLVNNSEVIVDIGAKVLCKKTVNGAKEIIQNKLNQALEIHDKLVKEITKLVQEVSKFEKEIREK